MNGIKNSVLNDDNYFFINDNFIIKTAIPLPRRLLINIHNVLEPLLPSKNKSHKLLNWRQG